MKQDRQQSGSTRARADNARYVVAPEPSLSQFRQFQSWQKKGPQRFGKLTRERTSVVLDVCHSLANVMYLAANLRPKLFNPKPNVSSLKCQTQTLDSSKLSKPQALMLEVVIFVSAQRYSPKPRTSDSGLLSGLYRGLLLAIVL